MSERVSERMSEWIVERASWLFIVIIFPLVSGKMHHTWWTTGRHKNHNCWQQLQFSGLLCVQLRIQTSWIGNTNMPGRRNMERRTSSLYRYEKSGVTVLVGRIKMQIFQRQYNVKWELESTRKAVNATYGAQFASLTLVNPILRSARVVVLVVTCFCWIWLILESLRLGSWDLSSQR